MTAKRRLEGDSLTRWLIAILCLFLSFKSCVVKGQAPTTTIKEYGYTAESYLQTDSVSKRTNKPVYLGYELALGRPIYTLKSNLTELNHLRVSNLGVIVGGVVANTFGKLKVNAGLYYSDASLPYSFDLFTGGLSAHAYLLRISSPKHHTVEPYFIGGISQQHIKFYGNYLDKNATRNFSTSEEQFLGKGITTQFNVGLGAEYQLENDHGDFIHLFAEVACGVPVAMHCTREVFDHTRIINPVSISIGISFGKIKERSK
ncbi:hypothetical protein [Chryseolinea lacunae]|uniref:Outer membrane protein beta-barrel domain-containing protein n=1 Tax=Chryseolinea lacunae TaxID=2801331 RepID=A0ABS1KYC2_9BACT|nr:hypothetical protein [Chryseolinea lacunae]MBL0744449.1 hypothetical protein [Chryseolinea lacunae]